MDLKFSTQIDTDEY